MTDLIIQLVIGALGGNAAGAILKDKSLGLIGNTIAGLLGGAGGVHLLNLINSDIGSNLIAQIGGAGVGGGIVMVIIGFIKSALTKK